MGKQLLRGLQNALGQVPRCRVEKLPRAFLVEADEDPGPLLEAVARAMVELEEAVAKEYPMFHKEMGPVWTGTLQALFDD